MAGVKYWDGINNRTIPNGSEGQQLTMTSGVPTWGAAGGSLALDDLTDVVITSVAANEGLLYNGSNWVNSKHGSSGHTGAVIVGGTAEVLGAASLSLTEMTPPSTPGSNIVLLYNSNIDGLPSIKNDAGNIARIIDPSKLLVYDHFWGDGIIGKWNTGGTSNGVAIATPTTTLTRGVVSIKQTGTPADNATAFLDWGAFPSIYWTDLPILEMRIKVNETTSHNPWFGFADTGSGATEGLWMGFDTDSSHTHWTSMEKHQNSNFGLTESSTLFDTNWHIWTFIPTSSSVLTIYLDGVLFQTISNISFATGLLAPVIYGRTRVAFTIKTVHCDYILACLP